MTKEKIIKEIQARINSAMVNGKDDIALCLRGLMDVILADTSRSCVDELYKIATKRNAELTVKLQKLMQNND